MIGHESRTSLISSAVGTGDAPLQKSAPQVKVLPSVVMVMVVLCFIHESRIIFGLIEHSDQIPNAK